MKSGINAKTNPEPVWGHPSPVQVPMSSSPVYLLCWQRSPYSWQLVECSFLPWWVWGLIGPTFGQLKTCSRLLTSTTGSCHSKKPNHPKKSSQDYSNGNYSRVEKYALVTGANKGGLETVRQIASEGVTVVLTARDEKRGTDATCMLHNTGLTNVVFHQLDVLDPVSIESLAKFIKDRFGRLDILVNNAGASGVVVDEERLKALNIDPRTWLSGKAVNMVQQVIKTSYETAVECLNTNFYGVQRLTEALLPLLQLSPSGARIVNVSSLRGELCRIRGDDLRNELEDLETLNEEKLDSILKRFLKDLKENTLEAGGWSLMLPAYSISKATLNAYTRVLAKRHPNMLINCVHPGYVNTDINWHTGPMSVEEGAQGPVKCALLPDGGPTGCYFDQTEVASF